MPLGSTYILYEKGSNNEILQLKSGVFIQKIAKTTAYDIVVKSDLGCVSPRQSVTTYVTGHEEKPLLKSVTRCGVGEITGKVATPLADVKYKWYSYATGGVPLYEEVEKTESTTEITGDFESRDYFVAASSDKKCESKDRDKISFTWNSKKPVDLGEDITICPGSPAIDLGKRIAIQQIEGYFTGTGIESGTRIFHPSIAKEGSHHITFNLTYGHGETPTCYENTMLKINVRRQVKKLLSQKQVTQSLA